MFIFDNGTTVKYPYSVLDLRLDNPDTSFPKEPSPECLASYNVFGVTPTLVPEVNRLTHTVRELQPTKNEQGDYVQVWETRELSAEEKAQARLIHVPQSVPALDGLRAVNHFGLSSFYENWCNAPERTFLEKAFINKAQTWRRDDPTLLAAATALGLTEAQVDDMFLYAGSLQ